MLVQVMVAMAIGAGLSYGVVALMGIIEVTTNAKNSTSAWNSSFLATMIVLLGIYQLGSWATASLFGWMLP